MYPQQEQSVPSDYLEQISPNAPKKSLLNMSRPLLVGAVAIIVILILGLIAAVATISNGGNSNEKLAARLVMIQTVAKDSTTNIKSSNLRAVNSELKTFLTNTIRDINPLLAKEDIEIDKLPKTLLNTKNDIELNARLEDARLNAVFDRTYAREMAYELSNILNLMQQIYNQTNDSDFKTFLTDATKNLTPTQEQFASFESIDS